MRAFFGLWVLSALSACGGKVGNSDSAVLATGGTLASVTSVATGGSVSTGASGGVSAQNTKAGGTNSGGEGTQPDETAIAGGGSRDIIGSGGSASGGSSASLLVLGTGGSPVATGGSGGAAGSETGGQNIGTGGASNSVVQEGPVDVLFMIDNSSSMADKQDVLAMSLPSIVTRLAQPYCLNALGQVVGQAQLDGKCAAGKLQFKPVRDLHIGIVTSSLGDHGAGTVCTPGTKTPYVDEQGGNLVQPPDTNDASHLVGALPRGQAAIAADAQVKESASLKLDPAGFLAWNSQSTVITAEDANSAGRAFSDMVRAVAEHGCGFESQLESWFRFLIDPVPPMYPITLDASSMAQRAGVDDAVLLQRKAFLRPDSLLAIVMLTDENDCSLRDTDFGWVAATSDRSIKTGSPACQSNPNDHCCFSCTASPPEGCEPCPSDAGAAPDDSAYQVNIRCWHQKRRFGYDFMYPVSRYVAALTKPELCPDQTFGDMDCDCTAAHAMGQTCSPGERRMPNPIYSNVLGQNSAGESVVSSSSAPPRATNTKVFLAGIVGVPWQDVGYADEAGRLKYIPVTDPIWNGPGASQQPASPAPQGIWQLIYGDDVASVIPGDIHMVESLEPRAGLPLPTAASDADPVHGHEWNTAYQDLQYACIFKLPTSRPCSCNSSVSGYSTCCYLHPNDCCETQYRYDGRRNPIAGEYLKPLCQGNTQVAAKAYPSQREIAVLRAYAQTAEIKGNSVVASICAKDAAIDTTDPGFGYNPATDAIVTRLAERLPKD